MAGQVRICYGHGCLSAFGFLFKSLPDLLRWLLDMKSILATFLLLLPLHLFAWSGAGHMIVAAEAYAELGTNLQAKVAEILKSHPDYEKWSSAYSKSGETSPDLATYIFMRSSTWLDEIRRSGGSASQYDHPHWHYIDYPLKPPTFPLEPGPAPQDDILFGIGECEKNLSDPASTPEIKAVYLATLIHLIGDLHQPLHCCSLVNSTYPNGDKGGNDFYVSPASKGIKLHSFWDGLLGTRIQARQQFNQAVQIKANYPRTELKELGKATTPKDWSLESRSVAIEKAYLHGELKGSTTPESAPALPDGYTKTAKSVAEKQAAVAGYRLADEIEKCVK